MQASIAVPVRQKLLAPDTGSWPLPALPPDPQKLGRGEGVNLRAAIPWSTTHTVPSDVGAARDELWDKQQLPEDWVCWLCPAGWDPQLHAAGGSW